MARRFASLPALLPALMLAAWIPAHAQSQQVARGSESIAGKAAATKPAPAKARAATTAERKRVQVTTAGAVPAAAAAPSASPAANSSGPVLMKDKSHCHSSGSDA